jgi:hypothetical protein
VEVHRLTDGRPLSGENPSPADLAVAITVLEGHHYEQITPGIAYLQNTRGREVVDRALAVHTRIHFWVQEKLLSCSADQRTAIYADFIQIAEVCILIWCCLELLLVSSSLLIIAGLLEA